MAEEKYIENAVIDNEHSLLRLRKDGIIEITCADNHIYEEEDIKQNHEAIKKLCPDKKAMVLNLVGKYTSISNEGREFVAKGSHKDFIKAEAFVLHSLAHNILARFYMVLNKPKVNTSYFTGEEEAAEWLKKQK